MTRAVGMRYVMGTFLTVETFGADSKKVERGRDAIFGEIQRLDELLSIYRPESEISRINQAAGLRAIRVSPQTFDVIERACRYARLSGGAFDPTAQRLGPVGRHYEAVRLNPIEQSVALPASMRLDLGGIGKGFALDSALARARDIPALEKIIIDFGGQLLFWTPSGAFDPVRVSIENPNDRDAILSTIEIASNGSLSTSSNAEHAEHLLDPRTGKPAEGVISASAWAPTATEAEVLSTALFILGPAESAALLKKCSGARAYIFSERSKPVAKGKT